MGITLNVLAAGMGTRYGGLKQIDPVGPNGETILDYSVYDAMQAGFDRVVFTIRRHIEKDFREHVGKRFEGCIDVAYVFQELDMLPDGFTVPADREKPWGTGHAVLCASDVIHEPFVVINADDFYGAESYRLLAEFLNAPSEDRVSAEYALVGFKLRNTLSEHGHVARGICECDESMYLKNVVERTKVLKKGHAAVFLDESGQEHALSGDEWVSMNLWGFTPSFFHPLKEAFTSFLQESATQPKAECYIPWVVDKLIAKGVAKCRVLPTGSPWFGVTYREDKPHVERSIRTLIQEGAYPEALWS